MRVTEMTQLAKYTASLVAVVACAATTGGGAWACAAAGVKVSQGGVGLWVPGEPFRGEMKPLEEGDWETIPPGKLPYATGRAPVLVSASLVAAIDDQKGVIAVYARHGGRLVQRGEVSLEGASRFAEYRLVRDAGQDRLGVEIQSAPGRVLATLSLAPDGILEFRPQGAEGLFVGARLKYGIVPSFVGADLVYAAQGEASAVRPPPKQCCIPSMNLLVGLIEGGDSMMVGVWPPGSQVASLRVSRQGSDKGFEGLSLQTAGRSFYLAFVEKPGLWHAEPLRPDYIEKDTAIGWRRPFEAKWIGRFYVASEEMHYPFYFRYERTKLWGRFVRGWFTWPVWFDGQKTVIHFEKQFPPRGELLIYFLESQPQRPVTGVLSPVEVMERALGKAEAARLLDFDGVQERVLLEHRNAVCAMTNTVQQWLNEGREAQHKAQIERYCDDVADFIRMIRQRIEEFDAFAARTKDFLRARATADPALADMAAGLEEILDQMQKIRRNDMPRESLDEVRRWTDQMKKLATGTGPGRNKKYEPLGAKCRSVAGTQDDMARALGILGVVLVEEAGKQGAASPAHAKLAEEVIARTRQVLRKPTWWEPRREYWPKSDPGRP
jgi:hypothetical protein